MKETVLTNLKQKYLRTRDEDDLYELMLACFRSNRDVLDVFPHLRWEDVERAKMVPFPEMAIQLTYKLLGLQTELGQETRPIQIQEDFEPPEYGLRGVVTAARDCLHRYSYCGWLFGDTALFISLRDMDLPETHFEMEAKANTLHMTHHMRLRLWHPQGEIRSLQWITKIREWIQEPRPNPVWRLIEEGKKKEAEDFLLESVGRKREGS